MSCMFCVSLLTSLKEKADKEPDTNPRVDCKLFYFVAILKSKAVDTKLDFFLTPIDLFGWRIFWLLAINTLGCTKNLL
jgi:hypothetical protein